MSQRGAMNQEALHRKREGGIHEDLFREAELQGSSNRTFGLVLSAFFFLVALGPLWRHHEPRLWALAPVLAFLILSLARPELLAPLNALWMRLGLVLQRIANPIVMGLLFFVTITPIAFVMRLLKKDPLELAWRPDTRSYWIDRRPPGPAPETMKDQF